MPSTWTAEAHERAGGRTWLYDFAWRSPTLGAAHTVEVPFVFGNGEGRMAARVLGSPAPPEFAALSGRIRQAWTAFATTGDPGWPRFSAPDRTTRIWDTLPRDEPYPLAGAHAVWDSLRG